MGWATYFEDIALRREEATSSTKAAVGPAGRRSRKHIPTSPDVFEAPTRGLTPDLSEAYYMLRWVYERFEPVLSEKYRQDNWHELSLRMERLVDDVRRFKSRTLVAASGAIIAHAQRLSDEMRQVVVNARLILTYLKDPVRELSVALDRVTRLKEKFSFLIFPRAEIELETRCIFVLHGSRALKVEIDELEKRAEELEIDLQGNVFERLLENEDTALGDKDGDR